MFDDKDVEEVGTGLGGDDMGNPLFLELVGIGDEVGFVVAVVNVFHDFHHVAGGLQFAIN